MHVVLKTPSKTIFLTCHKKGGGSFSYNLFCPNAEMLAAYSIRLS